MKKKQEKNTSNTCPWCIATSDTYTLTSLQQYLLSEGYSIEFHLRPVEGGTKQSVIELELKVGDKVVENILSNSDKWKHVFLYHWDNFSLQPVTRQDARALITGEELPSGKQVIKLFDKKKENAYAYQVSQKATMLLNQLKNKKEQKKGPVLVEKLQETYDKPVLNLTFLKGLDKVVADRLKAKGHKVLLKLMRKKTYIAIETI